MKHKRRPSDGPDSKRLLTEKFYNSAQEVCNMATLLKTEPAKRRGLYGLANLLNRVPTFKELSFKDKEPPNLKDFEQLASQVKYMYIAQGEWLFKAGDRHDKMFIILKGKLGVYRAP